MPALGLWGSQREFSGRSVRARARYTATGPRCTVGHRLVHRVRGRPRAARPLTRPVDALRILPSSAKGDPPLLNDFTAYRRTPLSSAPGCGGGFKQAQIDEFRDVQISHLPVANAIRPDHDPRSRASPTAGTGAGQEEHQAGRLCERKPEITRRCASRGCTSPSAVGGWGDRPRTSPSTRSSACSGFAFRQRRRSCGIQPSSPIEAADGSAASRGQPPQRRRQTRCAADRDVSQCFKTCSRT